MLEGNVVSGLRINQRNLYAYVLNHYKKNPDSLCKIPKSPLKMSNLPQYIKAIEKLEKLGFISVDRSGGQEYTEWIVKISGTQRLEEKTPSS